MVIQRWQSVILFIAAAILITSIFMPLAISMDQSSQVVTMTSFIPAVIVTTATSLLLLIDIFLFGNLKHQINVTWICVFMELISAIVTLLCVYNAGLGDSVLWWWAPVCWVAVFVLTLAAKALMTRDYKLLKSADRLF